MATLQLSNPNTSTSSLSTSLHRKLCLSRRTGPSSIWKRHCFVSSGTVSCSFASVESAKIKVVGVGGGGNNAVNRMIGSGLQIPGLVNVDFADVKAVIKDSGTAMLGIGVSSSKNRAEEATLAPLIGSSIQSATGVVYNITGGKDITLQEVNRVSQVVTSLADPSANIIFGAVVDDRYNGEIHVTIIATGFSQSFQKTHLTDPKAVKLLDKMAGSQESKGLPIPLKFSVSPSTVPSRPSPRKLFF